MASRWILEEFPSEAEEIIEQQRYVTLIILGPAHWFFLNLSHGLCLRICEDVYREEGYERRHNSAKVSQSGFCLFVFVFNILLFNEYGCPACIYICALLA